MTTIDNRKSGNLVQTLTLLLVVGIRAVRRTVKSTVNWRKAEII